MANPAIEQDVVLEKIYHMMEQGFSDGIIQKYLVKQGFSDADAQDILLEVSQNQVKETKPMQAQKTKQNSNPIAEILAQVLVIGIIYGVPVLLLLFGLTYVYGKIQIDMSTGIRSLAAAIFPLVTTLAFYKSNARQTAIQFFSHNKLVAFGISFVMAMLAAGTAVFLSNSQFSGIPVGEMIFSATLALMVFGNDNSEEISFLNVGAVSGFLMYVIVFGL